MTQLAFGVTGAAIGFVASGFNPLGAQIGFLVGSAIGGLVDPPKFEGPRLSDHKLQTSNYGRMIPYVFGTGRIAGNLIDQTDLEEHGQRTGGKGGRGGTTNYTYTASFDILICVGPLVAIKRIWENNKLIWDEASGEAPPCTIYLGDDNQAVDPTFEAIHGVGNVPAYNGYAHVVFTDRDLTATGNTIGQYEFEVVTKVGTFPWRVSTFDPAPDGAGVDGSTFSQGVVTVGSYGSLLGNWHYWEHSYDLDGNEDTGAAFEADLDTSLGTPVSLYPISNLQAASGGNVWYQRDRLITTILANPLGPGGASDVYALRGVYLSNNIYALCANTSTAHIGIARWPCTDGILSVDTGVHDAVYDFGAIGAVSALNLASSNNGNLYVSVDAGAILTLYEFDSDLNITRQWDLSAANAANPLINGNNFTVYQNAVGDLILCANSGNVGFKTARAYYLRSEGSPLAVDEIGNVTQSLNSAVVQLDDSGYAILADGIISLIPPPDGETLADVVAAITELGPAGGGAAALSGGSPALYNVDELTGTVNWFVIASVMTKKNAIEALRSVYLFDAVESDDAVVFKKRDGTSIDTIPDDDLCARSYGEDSDAPLRTIRTREQGLPQNVSMSFFDIEADYQQGLADSPRISTDSEQKTVLEVPVGFTMTEAKQRCWALQVEEWIGREKFEFTLPRKYSYLEPCDIINVRGRVVRILTRTKLPNGVLKFTAVLQAPSIYTQDGVAGTGGFVSQPTPADNVSTQLVLLDIPNISQADPPFGFRAAMGPARDGPWTGAALFKSLDDGTSYTQIAITGVPSVIGATADTTTGISPTVSGVLASYGGGDTVDESELCIRLTDDDAELESITSTALANGGNLCAISRGYSVGSPTTLQWEILQFRDATLVDTKTYTIKGFLRGRKGSLTTGHAVGDIFVLLSSSIAVDAPESELNLRLKYKAVSFGQSILDAGYQYFVNTGLGAEAFYDTERDHLPPFTGDTGSPGGGVQGLVPAPAAGDCAAGKYLDACGTWSVPAGSGGSPSGGSTSPLTTKGDIWGYSNVDARIPVGAENTVLTAHAGAALGVSWQSPVTLISDFVGDAGSPGGGVRGLVPAPASGDLAAGKFLSAGGTWAVIPFGTGGKCIQVCASDQVTALVAATSVVVFRMPFAMTVTEVRASLKTAGTGSPTTNVQVDINKNGVSILSTKLTIDAGELTSTTAATPAVISDASLADDSEIEIDIDAVDGNAVGLVVTIIGT